MDTTIPENTPQKQCTRCKQWKPATLAFFHRKRKTSLNSWCRQCLIEYNRKKNGVLPPPPPNEKRCRVCKACKPATTAFFTKAKGCAYGVNSTCNECTQKVACENIKNLSPDIMKTCSKCQVSKPATLEFFNVRSARKNGLQPWCKDCNIAWKQNHSDLRKQQGSAYRQSHASEIKQYYETHKQEFVIYRRLLYEANCERIKERSREYTLTHKEQVSKNKHRYHVLHRDEMKAKNRNRRAQRRKAIGVFTAKDERQQYERQKGKCYYCHRKVTKGGYHLDHVIPISRGGSNMPDNIVVTCPTCNLRKHNKLPHEWPEGNRLL